MLKKIEQQNRTIDYIKKLYKDKTGQDVVMPMSWEQSLGIAIEQTPSLPFPQYGDSDEKIVDLRTAIDALNLPTRINATKIPLTSFSANNKFHMVEHISLSGFKNLGFSKQLFRELLSRVVQMRSLSSLALRNNGIEDNCAEQIQTLFNIKRISRVDLSCNKLDFNSPTISELSATEWKDMAHLLVNTMCSFMKIKLHIHSLGLIDSKIDQQSMELVAGVLQQSSTAKKQKQVRINYLDFSFCYLDKPVFNTLLKAVGASTCLISLNLSNNNLGEASALSLCKTLQSSVSMIRVNLSGNLLQDDFAQGLSECLGKNQIIQVIDISKNNIGQKGAKIIYQVLSNKNDTLESLGDYHTNQRMGQQLIQKIRKALKINKVSKQIRSKIIAQQAELSSVQISNRQTEAFLQAEYNDFDLLVPIAVSNPLRDDPLQVHVWGFD